jgi:hypothetical protein
MIDSLPGSRQSRRRIFESCLDLMFGYIVSRPERYTAALRVVMMIPREHRSQLSQMDVLSGQRRQNRHTRRMVGLQQLLRLFLGGRRR